MQLFCRRRPYNASPSVIRRQIVFSSHLGSLNSIHYFEIEFCIGVVGVAHIISLHLIKQSSIVLSLVFSLLHRSVEFGTYFFNAADVCLAATHRLSHCRLYFLALGCH